MQLNNISQENEYLQRDKEEFLEEVKNKNDRNINLEERIFELEKELKKSWQDELNILLSLQKTYDNYNLNELISKLNLEQKIIKLENNIEHIDTIDLEENKDFSDKEKKYLKKIEELKNKLSNNDSNQIVKNNLKIIDKNTLEELSSQLKDYLFKSKTTKLVRDMNKKLVILLLQLSTIILILQHLIN